MAQTESFRLARDPVVLLVALVAPLLQLISSLVFPLTDEQQGILNAAFAALFGIIAAFRVSVDKALPLLVGFAQAVIAVGVGFGMEIDPTAQSAILAVIGLVSSYFVRTQVSPKDTVVINAPRMAA
jgi:hypothetical protein